MPEAQDEVRIRRLTLRGREPARETVSAALARPDWPRTDPGETLFLRHIQVTGAAPEIGARAAARARGLAREAVDGWDPAADGAPAVRFATRAELIACLLRDLLVGDLPRRWYWRGWGQLFGLPAGRASAAVLAREPLELPAATARLAQDRLGPTLWQALTAQDALTILTSVQQSTGWPVLPAAERHPTARLGGTLAGPATAPRRPADLPTPLPSRWSPGDLRLRLAAVLDLWQRAPQRLSGSHAGAALAERERDLAGASAPVEDPTPSRPTALPPAAAGPVAATPARSTAAGTTPNLAGSGRRPARDAEAGRQLPRSRGGATTASEPGAATETPPPSAAERPALDAVGAPPPARSASVGPALAASDAGAGPATPAGGAARSPPLEHPEPLRSRLVTRQGGIFYLLNLLALPQAQALLGEEAESPRAAGWVWLHQLGTALSCAPDAPLQRFLAVQAGLDDPEVLAALPRTPHLPALLRLGAARCGPEVWGPGLCQVPALVLADRSHLDVHYRLADARLAVRRVGLDLDPGWLPWLGRVVAFHYGQPPLGEVLA
jgi:hypothetical protein